MHKRKSEAREMGTIIEAPAGNCSLTQRVHSKEREVGKSRAREEPQRRKTSYFSTHLSKAFRVPEYHHRTVALLSPLQRLGTGRNRGEPTPPSL